MEKKTYEAWLSEVKEIAQLNEITLPRGDDLRSFYEQGISSSWYFEEDERVSSQFGKTVR